MKAAFGLRFTFGLAAFLAAFLGAAFLGAAFFFGAAFLAAFFGAAFLAAFLATAFFAGAFFFAFVATVFKIFLVKPDANKYRMTEVKTPSAKKLFTTNQLL
jgi:membrane protein implicated in regulation of membrane protease activity